MPALVDHFTGQPLEQPTTSVDSITGQVRTYDPSTNTYSLGPPPSPTSSPGADPANSISGIPADSSQPALNTNQPTSAFANVPGVSTPGNPSSQPAGTSSSFQPTSTSQLLMNPDTGAGNPNNDPGLANPRNDYHPDAAPTVVPVTQTTNPDNQVQFSDLNSNFTPNVLDQYSTYSYYFILFMLPYGQMNVTDPATVMSVNTPKIILAETGATGLNIKDVTIDAAVGPGFRGLNASGKTFTINMVEPAGFSFYDKIYYAARTLKLPNYTKSPLFLGLKFLGQVDVFSGVGGTGPMNTGEQINPIDNATWVWPLQIQKLESSFKDGFGYYNLTAIGYNEYGESAVVTNQKNSFITNATDLTHFFDDYADFLDKSELQYRLTAIGQTPTTGKAYGINVPVNKFHIVLVSDTWGGDFTSTKQTIRYDGQNPDYFPSRSGSYTVDKLGTTASFPKDMSIRQVIDLAMASCPYIQTLVMQSKNADSGKDPSIEDIYSQLWRIEVKATINTDPMSYDWVNNDFTRTYTYYVYNYKSHSPVRVPEASSNPSSDNSAPTDPNQALVDLPTQQATIQTLQNDKFLVKRYDYLYTGLNVDVVSLDLNINWMWAAVQPIYEGTRTYATNTSPALIPTANDFLQKRSQTLELASLINTTQANLNSILAEAQSLQLQVQNGSAPPNAEQTINNDLVLANQVQGQLIEERALAGNSYNQAQADATSVQDLLAQSNLTSTQYAENLSTNLSDFPPIPLTMSPEVISSSSKVNWSVEESWQRGRTLLGATLNQLLGVSNNLMTINMEIRGDPYWIGPTVLDPDYYTLNQQMTSTATRPFYQLGEHGFALIFRFPSGFDQYGNINFAAGDTGQNNISASEVICGIYYVRTCSHRFVDGKFTQALDCYRDTNTNVRGIIS